MDASFEQTLVEVWRQPLLENAKTVVLRAESFPVRRTAERVLRQVEFTFVGNEIRGLEQNPDTESRWAQMARSGKKVMQFLSEGRYVANVVDGKVTLTVGERGTTARNLWLERQEEHNLSPKNSATTRRPSDIFIRVRCGQFPS
jgi:hypothetical protein